MKTEEAVTLPTGHTCVLERSVCACAPCKYLCSAEQLRIKLEPTTTEEPDMTDTEILPALPRRGTDDAPRVPLWPQPEPSPGGVPRFTVDYATMRRIAQALRDSSS
jgi:hypothetical protein